MLSDDGTTLVFTTQMGFMPAAVVTRSALTTPFDIENVFQFPSIGTNAYFVRPINISQNGLTIQLTAEQDPSGGIWEIFAFTKDSGTSVSYTRNSSATGYLCPVLVSPDNMIIDTDNGFFMPYFGCSQAPYSSFAQSYPSRTTPLQLVVYSPVYTANGSAGNTDSFPFPLNYTAPQGSFTFQVPVIFSKDGSRVFLLPDLNQSPSLSGNVFYVSNLSDASVTSLASFSSSCSSSINVVRWDAINTPFCVSRDGAVLVLIKTNSMSIHMNTIGDSHTE